MSAVVNMIGLIAATLLIVYIGYLLVKQWLYNMEGIPGPPSYPLIYHTPYTFGADCYLTRRRKWAEQFRSEGLYRTRDAFFSSSDLVVLLKPEYVKRVCQNPELFGRYSDVGKVFPIADTGILCCGLQDHRFQKKLLAKAFSASHVQNYLPVFNRHTEKLIDIWKKEIGDTPEGKKMDVKKYVSSFTFDVIADAAFGYSVSAQTSQSNFVTQLKRSLENLIMIMILRSIPVIGKLPFGPGKSINDCDEATMDILKKVLTERKEKSEKGLLTKEEENDILSVMLNEREENTNGRLTDEVIKSNIFTFFLAGHETSATAIPVTFLFLAKHPEIQERARKEIKDVIGDKEEVSMENTHSIPYTVACIKESLRLIPVVSTNGRISKIDTKFGKYTIPKGSVLLFDYFVLNADADDFDDSLNFNPERYMENSGVKAGTSFSFGYGPYSCIGKHFAIAEMKVMIARILQNFKLTLDSGDDVQSWTQRFTLTPNSPIVIRITPL